MKKFILAFALFALGSLDVLAAGGWGVAPPFSAVQGATISGVSAWGTSISGPGYLIAWYQDPSAQWHSLGAIYGGGSGPGQRLPSSGAVGLPSITVSSVGTYTLAVYSYSTNSPTSVPAGSQEVQQTITVSSPVTRTLTISAPASVYAGQGFSIPTNASTSATDAEQIGFYHGDYSTDGGSTWTSFTSAANAGKSASYSANGTAGAVGSTVMVRVRIAFRGGAAGDVDYNGTAINWSGTWDGWSAPPAKFASISVVAPPNTAPSGTYTINGVNSSASVYFGQSVNIASTVTDPDGNLTVHSFFWDQGSNLTWTHPIIAWNYPADQTGWSNLNLGPANGYNVLNGSSSTKSFTFTGPRPGTFVFHCAASDDIAWVGVDTNYVLNVAVNKTTPSYTGGGNITRTSSAGNTYTVVAGDLNVSFYNQFSGAVTAPTGAVTYSIVGPGTAVTAGTVLSPGSYTVRASYPGDSNYNSNTADYTWTINPTAPVITSAGTATGQVGSAFSYSITASNTPVSYSATGLPAGLSINTATGLISGTPTATGSSSITLGATNAGGTGTKTLTLTVNPATPVISSAAAASGQVGVAFSYQITASNSPTSFSASGLPAGLSVNTSTGLISGTPTGAATSSITLGATNAGGTGNKTLTLTVNPATPVISSAATATGQIGVAFSYQIVASNSPTSYSASGLPAGLSVNTSTGLISGTPTATGSSSVTLGATNAGGTGSKTLTLTVNPATPVISSAATASGQVGVAFSYQITASNSPTSFSASGLPAGLSVNTSTGLVSGTPTTAATSTITLGAANAGGTGNKTLTLTVASASAPVISSAATATGQVGVAFSYQITASNSPTSYSASGLPAGLSVNTTTGLISGTPTTAAVSSITLGATNAAGTGNKTLTLTVNPATPVISSAATASGQVGVAFSYQITASNSPTSFSASPLPAGLSINTTTGLISGTPTTAATTSVTLGATNAGGTGNKTLTLTVSAAVTPVVTSAATASGQVGVAFSYQITASNNPTSFSATGLPAGLTVNTTSGLISGTPTTAAVSTVTLGAINSAGTGTKTLTLTVNPATPVISSATTKTGQVGVAFSYQITASNSPTSFSASPLPAGLSINTTTGVISGTPTTAAVTSVTLGATNAGGTGTKTLTVTINPATPVISNTSMPNAQVGVPYSFQITASNSPTSYSASGLPAGLSVNTSSGLISGTPTTAGSSSVTVGATNAGGTGNKTMTLTVNPATPVISSAATASGQVGVAFSYQITASNSPTSFSASGLPAGVTVNTTTGLISGTPTAAATSSVTLGATNAGGTGTKTLTLTVIANVPPQSRIRTASTTRIFGQAFEFFTDAKDADGNLSTIFGYVRGPGTYTVGSPWTGWTTLFTTPVAASGSNSAMISYLPQAVGSYNYCGSADDSASTHAANVLSAWADWNVWNTPASNVSVGTFTVTAATPVGTFTAKTFTGSHALTAADLNASFANPYSASVPAPSGGISYSIVSAAGTGASPTGGAVSVGTVLAPGYYVIRASCSADGNYSTGTIDSGFTILATVTAETDTDGDGMPDAFEQAYGLNKNVNDANLDLDGDGVSNIDEYNSWRNPNGQDDIWVKNGLTGLPITITVMGRGTGTVTLTENGVSSTFRFAAASGNPWTNAILDVNPSYVTGIAVTSVYGVPDTIQVSASAGMTDYFVMAKLDPVVQPQVQPVIEINGKSVDGISKSEIVGNSFTVKTTPGAKLPFGVMQSSNLGVNRMLEFGLGGGRSGRTAGRILVALGSWAGGPWTANIDQGETMEGSAQNATHFQAKVPAGYVDFTRSRNRMTVNYYNDSTPWSGTFQNFSSATPVATYTVDLMPGGPTGSVPTPSHAATWNFWQSQRYVITRTVGGISHILEHETHYQIALNQNPTSQPYNGPGGGTVDTYVNLYSTITRMWPWRLASAPRSGLVRSERYIVDVVVKVGSMGAPNTTYGTPGLVQTSYLGADETSAVGNYEELGTSPHDDYMMRAVPLSVGIGVDRHDLPNKGTGPSVNGLAMAQTPSIAYNGMGGSVYTEYLSYSVILNGGNNLGSQPVIAMGEPKYTATSFGDNPSINTDGIGVSTLNSNDLVSTYNYGTELVDGRAAISSVSITQGSTQIGGSSIAYDTTGTFNGLSTTLTTVNQLVQPGVSLSTKTLTYSRRVADPDLRSRSLSVRRPDDTKTSYAYQRGTLSGSTWAPSPTGAHLLTAELTGKVGTTLASYGTAAIDALDLDPNHSTVSETITDASGRVLREASYVYQGGTTFSLLSATYSTYDILGNLVLKADQPGSNPTGRIFYEASFSGFQKVLEKDEQGITRTYQYDAYNRVDWMKRASASANGSTIPETKTTYRYDAIGRMQQEVMSSDTEGDQLMTSYTYDTSSRTKSTTKPGGFVTTTSYDSPVQTTTTLPSGATKVVVLYKDGHPKSATGSAMPDSSISYAYDGSGNLKTTRITAGQTGVQTVDWAGRTISSDTATWSGGTRTTSTTYNSVGQLIKEEVKSGGVSIALPHLYQYDSYGRPYREGMDVDGNGSIDPATDFGVKEYESFFQVGAPGDAANWYLYKAQKIWPYAGTNAGSYRYSEQSYTQFSGLTAAVTVHSIIFDLDRNRAEATSTVDRANKMLTTATTAAGTNQSVVEVSLNGLSVSSSSAQGQTKITTYDGLGRLESTNDPRIGMSSVLYYPNTTLVEYSIAPDYQITSFGYDAAGHVSSQANNNNKWVYSQYDLAGNLAYTWGDTVNPVHYEYNELNQKIAMHTYRTGTWTGAGFPGGFSATGDVTTWNYQSTTGLVISKVDALNQTTSYQYDNLDRASKRTDGRGWVTNYTYTSAGQPYQINYTDGITPAITYVYDRSGRVLSVGDITGTRSFAYYDAWTDPTYDNDLLNKSARLKSESLTAYFGSHVINYGYQYSVAGRSNGAINSLAIDAGSLYAVGYGYDTVGRPASVTYNAITPFVYTYVPNSNLVDTVAQGTTGYKRDYDYETTSHRISTLKNQFGSVTANTVEDRVTCDFLGQRSTEKIAGSAWMTTLGRGTEAGVHVDYQYTDRYELDYSAKYQLTSGWGVGGFKTNTDRTYNYDPIGNRTSDIIGGVSGTYTPNQLNQYASAPNSASMTYDGNGNLKVDGTRNYDYDGENRLITVTQGTSVWHYEYDYLNRRVRKYGTGITEQRFIYDGWNLIAETDASGNVTRRYAWGLDISETLQGAGGVGGLLLIQDGSSTYYPLYDVSHNVIGLYNGSGGIDSAYEYDPFGRIQTSVGTYAAANPFRFSTKYTDNETSFVYYGVRYYAPTLGRFINRDPIQEAGGINLYGFCGSDGINRYDMLGMAGGLLDWIQTLFKPSAPPPPPNEPIYGENKDGKTVPVTLPTFSFTVPRDSGSTQDQSNNVSNVNETDPYGQIAAAERYGEFREYRDPGAGWGFDGAVQHLRGFRDTVAGVASMVRHPIDAYNNFRTVREPLTPYGNKLENALRSIKISLHSPYGRGTLTANLVLGRALGLAGPTANGLRAGLTLETAASRTVALDSNAFYALKQLRASGTLQAGDRLVITPSVQSELLGHGLTQADFSAAGIEALSESPVGVSVPAGRLSEVLRGFGGPGAESAAPDALNVSEAAASGADLFLTNDGQVLKAFEGGVTLPNTGGVSIDVAPVSN